MTRTRPRTHNQDLGSFGEHLAAAHLVRAGMVVLDRNWRCKGGELDLVLRDADALVCCEVKTRSGLAYGDPLEAVTPVKVARLRVLAESWVDQRWLPEHDARPPELRIDLVGVLVDRAGRPRVEHIRGAC